ncbi:hypothetical protein Hanom_Chr09g00837801 [Helianthus anomalus]
MKFITSTVGIVRFLLGCVKCFIKHTTLFDKVMDRHRCYHNTHLVLVCVINMHISQ